MRDTGPGDSGGGDALEPDSTTSTDATADSGVGPDATGLPDAVVILDGGADPNNPNNANLDTDCDGLSDAEEFATVYPNGQKTDPNNPDSDGDGIPDGVELGRTGPVPGTSCPNLALDADPATRTSPVNADTDSDGIPDGLEDANHNGRVDQGELNPLSRDSDGDGIPDGVEDVNHNGVADQGETDGTKRDTDGDGIGDGLEDVNHNGHTDPGETDPRNADSDGDGLADGVEDANHDGIREPYETDPRSADTDCDGVPDGAETQAGTSPVVADTDGDGLTDGQEVGATTAVAGTSCPRFVPDVDPTTHTDPLDFDTDHDGLPDGAEDANHNGRVDTGETDPHNADSDGDGLPDGEEVAAGYNPTDPNSPSPNIRGGLNAVCADANLKVVNFNVGGSNHWTLSTELSTTYTPVTVSAAGVGVDVAALDDAGSPAGTNPVAGFIARMPVIAGGPGTAAGQTTAVNARIGAGSAVEGLAVTPRTSPRTITSHDGFETAVSGIVDVSVVAGSRSAADVRNALVRLSTGLAARDFVGLPTTTPGPTSNQFVYMYQVLVRTNPQEVIVVLALLDRSHFDNMADNGAIMLADLTNGTALALANADRTKECNPFVTGTQAIADFLWMADISGSTDDDRGRIVSAGSAVFNALQTNGVDFRMGVVPHIQNAIHRGNVGMMRGVGFTRDANQFASYLQDTTDTDGCEYGLDAIRQGINHALPRTTAGHAEDPQKFRDNAQIAVIYISDEYSQEVSMESDCGPGLPSCDTGISDLYSTGDESICQIVPNATQQSCISTTVQPYINQLRNNNAIAFAQIISPSAVAVECTGYACPQPGSQPENEPGLGYTEVVTAVGGTFYSPCVDNPGAALQSIIDAVSGAASQFQLSGAPISSTIKVGITRIGTGGSGGTDIVPRDRDNGFDYDPVANSIFFHGTTYRPNRNDLVVVSYREWHQPAPPCGGPCPTGQICDPQLGVCSCDQAACNACGSGRACDSTCQCRCTADCGGACGAGQVCNQQTCACECAPNCGGACPSGTVCNPATCGCECDSSCGGACAGTDLACDRGSCSCQCPADCGGRCAQGTACNTSTCTCGCSADCNTHCPGMAECDPANNCQCACPNNCGGTCTGSQVCDPSTCACACPANCEQTRGCQNREICDPASDCNCTCPAECGGCATNETCDPVHCKCVPIV